MSTRARVITAAAALWGGALLSAVAQFGDAGTLQTLLGIGFFIGVFVTVAVMVGTAITSRSSRRGNARRREQIQASGGYEALADRAAQSEHVT